MVKGGAWYYLHNSSEQMHGSAVDAPSSRVVMLKRRIKTLLLGDFAPHNACGVNRRLEAQKCICTEISLECHAVRYLIIFII